MAPIPPGGATRRHGNADLWPVLPVGAGTARRRRAAGRTPNWSRPATAWSRAPTAWSQHQKNPLQRGISANPHFSTSGALAESQKAPCGRCTGAWRPPHRAERRAGKGTPTSGQFSRWGPAQPAEGGRREGPPIGVAPLQRGVAPLQRGVSASRPRYSVESRGYSVESRPYSVESAPTEPATAWSRTPPAWSQRQQNPLQRGVAPLQRGVSASRTRYSVESRPYSVESAPADPATAWSHAPTAWSQHQTNPLQRGVTRLQRGASANPHFSTSGALAESQKAPCGRCTGAWRPPHRAERRAGTGTPTSGQFSRWGPAQPAEGGRREGLPIGVAPLQRGVTPLQRGVSASRTRYSVESRPYSVESAPTDPATAWSHAATAWSQRQQTPKPSSTAWSQARSPGPYSVESYSVTRLTRAWRPAPIRISQPRERSPSRRRRHADAALAHGAHPTGRSDAQARERRPPVGTARRRRAAGRTPSWSRPATAWCRTATAWSQHQQTPLQRGVAPLQRGVSASRTPYSVESAPTERATAWSPRRHRRRPSVESPPTRPPRPPILQV